MDIDVINAFRTIEKHGFNGLGEKEINYIQKSLQRNIPQEVNLLNACQIIGEYEFKAFDNQLSMKKAEGILQSIAEIGHDLRQKLEEKRFHDYAQEEAGIKFDRFFKFNLKPFKMVPGIQVAEVGKLSHNSNDPETKVTIRTTSEEVTMTMSEFKSGIILEETSHG